MTSHADLPTHGPPTRLSDEPGASGQLLQNTKGTEFRLPPQEFSELVVKRRRHARRAVLYSGSLALAVPALAAFVWLRVAPSPEAGIAPESRPLAHERPRKEQTQNLPAQSETGLAPAGAQADRAEPAPEPLPEKRTLGRKAPERSRHAQAREELPVAPSPEPQADPVVPLPEPISPVREPLPESEAVAPTSQAATNPRPANPTPKAPKNCQALTDAGHYVDAAKCQGERATEGSGTTAELALLSKARLELRALHRPDLALETLRAYRARFPHGVLTREAQIAEAQAMKAKGAAKP